MQLILKYNKIQKKIKSYNKKIFSKVPSKNVTFIGFLDGTLPLVIDLLRADKTNLSSMDYLFYDNNNFTKLKTKHEENKHIVLIFDHFKNQNNEIISKTIDYIKTNINPSSISLYGILKDRDYSKVFDEELDFILETDPNVKYSGYGINSDIQITDYLNIYSND